jgi:hypothetical protein
MNQGLEVLNLQSVLYLMIQPSIFFHRHFKCVSVWFQNVVSGGMFNPLLYSLLADKIVPSLELFVLLDGVCVWLKDRNSESVTRRGG